MWWNNADGPYFTDEHIVTVAEMGKYARTHNKSLLGDYTDSQIIEEFMENYWRNTDVYDPLFIRKYKNYFYFDQTGEEDVEDVYEAFSDGVMAFLLLNEKKYAQLFKIEGLTTEIGSETILSDYKITESKEGDREVERWYVSGARQDTSENTSGEREDVTTDQIMAYNSNSFVDQGKSTFEKGTEEDSSEYNKGSQTDQEEVSETNGHNITTSGTKGNPYENMEKFITAWDAYSFYGKIFEDIAKAFLLL